jgi:phosphatidylserine decarboxylase
VSENALTHTPREGGFEAAKGRAVIAGLRLLPRNFMSRVAGHVARVSLPGPLRRAQLRSFGKTFGVNFDEVKEPLDSFRNVQDFFIRELKEGARPIDEAADAFVSPCDGAWGQAGEVAAGQMLQVKGQSYSVRALLDDDELAARFEGGTYATLYLSPKDYHRFHSPCAGAVVRADYIPGTLWPVNRAGVRYVDGLFAQNERIVAYLEPEGGPEGALLAMVAVGATMVGKVHVNFDDLTTNVPGTPRTERRYEGEQRPALAKGGEWGRFEFGSTIVLVATPGLVDLEVGPAGEALRLGRRIGTLLTG